MEQRVSMVTLGVADLERSRTFYEGLGWRGDQAGDGLLPSGRHGHLLWGRSDLAPDAGLQDAGSGEVFRGIALAHNVRSSSEVDAVVAGAESLGAQVTRRPAETFYGGYAGYFRDPDGHVWEIAWNPGFQMSESGSVTVPDFGREG